MALKIPWKDAVMVGYYDYNKIFSMSLLTNMKVFIDVPKKKREKIDTNVSVWLADTEQGLLFGKVGIFAEHISKSGIIIKRLVLNGQILCQISKIVRNCPPLTSRFHSKCVGEPMVIVKLKKNCERPLLGQSLVWPFWATVETWQCNMADL